MKKNKLSILLIITLVLNLVAGCSSNQVVTNTNGENANQIPKQTTSSKKQSDYILNTGYYVLDYCATDSEIIDVLNHVEVPNEPKSLGEVKLIELNKVTVSVAKFVPVTIEEAQANIKLEIEKNRKLVESDKEKIEEGDTANIDYTGYLRGEKFSGGSDTGYDLKIGSGTFIPGFEEQLVGAKVGETKEVKVTFPEDYQSPLLAGREATFEVKINQIKEEKADDYNELYVIAHTKTGSTSIEEYENEIKDQLTEEKREQFLNQVYVQIEDKIVEQSSFTPTEEGLAYMFALQIDNAKNMAEMYQVPLDEFMKNYASSVTEFVETIREQTDIALKEYVVLRELGKKFDVPKVTDTSRIEWAKELLRNYGEEEPKDEEILQLIKLYGIDQIDNQIIFSAIAPETMKQVIIEYIGE